MSTPTDDTSTAPASDEQSTPDANQQLGSF
jgi:hypothetical protein